MSLRAAVLAEALEWVGTPYRHMGRVKGHGADCVMLLAEVYEAAGIVPHIDVPFFCPDWHLHRGEERYANGLIKYCRPVDSPEPGDIALFRFGRCFAHGAIVTAWPRLVHAWNRSGVVEGDAMGPPLRGRPVLFFSPFARRQNGKVAVMLTRILTSDMPESERRRFKIVRLDSGAGLSGWPLEANADTGHCVVRHEVPNCPAEDKWYEFGPNGLAIVGRLLALVVAIGFAASLSACAGLGGTAPPPQPTPAGIEAAVQQIAAISADPAAAWQAGDYAVRAACDGYLNDLAQRQAGFGLASGAVGTSGLAAAGIAASRANPVAAALATSAAALAQTFLGQFQNAGALPYSAETTALIQNALDAYERAVRPPQSLAEAAGDVEGAWWLCSPAGYAELAAKSIGSAQVSASAVPLAAAMTPTFAGPSRPHVLVNGR